MDRIDAHQHFWCYNADEYPWIDDQHAALKRDFLPADLTAAQEGTGIAGSIAVQARQSLTESRWLLDLAAANPTIRGVVGWVDLRAEDLDTQLDELVRDRRFVGVRHVLHDEADDTFMLRPDFLRGLGQLADYDLAYDLLLFPKHLQLAAEVVGRFPRQRFILDHLAKPFIAGGIISPWDEHLRKLAAHDNVACKVSGLVTEADWQSWTVADFKPYLDVVFDAFGEDRVLFGSDWPVCTVAATYEQVLAIIADYLTEQPAAVQEKIFGGNCTNWYRLP